MTTPDSIATPALSVVIETFNATPESRVQLEDVLGRLRDQTIPQEQIERIVVIDEGRRELADFVRRMDPAAEVVLTPDATYYGMKRCGMKHARGSTIALLDSDCLPCKDWASQIIATIAHGADVVAGKVRFPAGSSLARTFAVFDYGHIRNEPDGQAACFNVSNAGLTREIAAKHPFDERLTRFGGGALLGRRLRSLGYRIVYNPAAAAVHNDKGVRKHLVVRFRTGHEAVALSRLDEAGVLPDSRLMRFGLLAPFVIAARRILFDCRTVVTNRRDLDIAAYEIPYFVAASVAIRMIEAMGGLTTTILPGYLSRRYGW